MYVSKVEIGKSLSIDKFSYASSLWVRASSRMERISSSSTSASRATDTPFAKWVSTSRSTCSRTSSARPGGAPVAGPAHEHRLQALQLGAHPHRRLEAGQGAK